MAKQSTKPKRNRGTFRKGQSGNPAGRPQGSTNHDTELRKAEEQAMELAANICDVVKETVTQALGKTGDERLIPLIETIADVAADMVHEGEIGPSPIALLRNWYESDIEGEDREFFVHVGLPQNCSWATFKRHYTTRGRIDTARHAADLRSFPPIVARLKELKEEAA